MLESTLTRSTIENIDDAVEKTSFADAVSVIKDLRPINRLPEDAIKSLAELTENLQIEAGISISSIVRDSEYVHYLVEGTLAFLDSANSKTLLNATDASCVNAVDRRINGSVDLVTETNCFLARLPWSELENQLLQHAPSELSSSTLEVKDLLASTCSDWMVRLLQSDLISMLPAANIQEVLAGVEVLQVAADEVIINQGDDPDHFYIIEGGKFSVYRDIKTTGRQIELATLSTGDFFGEEALITGNQRGTSVKATTAAKLLKVKGEQFKKSIVESTITRESGANAHELLGQGTQLIDVRETAQFEAGHVPNSINLVLNLLRINSNQLDKAAKYLVVADIPNAAALATFLLRVRGFDASCLDQAIESYTDEYQIELVSEPVKAISTDPAPKIETAGDDLAKPTLAQITQLAAEHTDRTDRPAPVEDYANTVTGIGLADLIEELNDSYETDSETPTPSASPTLTNAPAHLNEVQSQLSDGLDFDMSASDTVETLDTPNVDSHANGNKKIRSDESINAEVSRLVALETAKLRQEFEQEFSEKAATYKRAALQSMHAHKEKLDLQFRNKQKTLLANSQKLIALANKISQQKAEVEKARKSIAEAKR